MRKLTAAILAIILCTITMAAGSEGIDLAGYSYEELLEIRDQVDSRLEELKRQYEIEHANRIFAFENPELILFIDRTVTQQPVITYAAEDAPRQTAFIWSSSDEKTATVNANGTVRAIAPGDAVITAAAADNPYLSTSYTVQCAIPVDGITVWGPPEPLVLGAEAEKAAYEAGYSIEPEDAYFQDVLWASSDETVLTIDEYGKLQAVQPGKATITATSLENPPARGRAVSGSCEVTVIQTVTSLDGPQETIVIQTGEKKTLELIIAPENASNRTVLYTSTDPEVASVDANGTVTAVSCGECDILCEAADGYGAAAKCHIQAVKAVTGVTVPTEQMILPVGGTGTIEAVITPEDASDQRLVWTSTNVFVARVADGKVEAVGQGDCVITCTTQDGTEISASIRVHVPTFFIESDAYTVTGKQGLTIPVIRNQEDCALELEGENEYFTASWTAEGLKIEPAAAGTGTIRVSNGAAPEDTVTITVSIENSAVYNQESYPAIAYMELVRVPDLYEKAQISIHGRILHISDENDMKTFMVGTAGEKYTDEVIWVRCDPALLPEDTEITGGEMITVYGLFRLERSWSEVLQAETTVPALDAEKIVLARQNPEIAPGD